MLRKNKVAIIQACVVSLMMLGATSCSTTKRIPENEHLYTGIRKIDFVNSDKSKHGALAREEIEAVLAYAPNNSLMGSSKYRFPLPIGLWAWNLLDGQQSGHGHFKRWLYNTFATPPVYISTVNPEVRARVAGNTLSNYGYFDGKVSYNVVDTRNPKKQKIDYIVNMGKPAIIDTISIEGFVPVADSLIRSKASASLLRVGDAFNVVNLEDERTRVSNLLRNNGYYYYSPSYITYEADTVHQHGNVSLRMESANSIPDLAKRQWRIGNLQMTVRRDQTEALTDTFRRGSFSYYHGGEKMPIRASALFRKFDFRRGDLFSLDAQSSTIQKVNQMGLFSRVTMKYVPHDTLTSDLLDVTFDAVLDKSLEGELSCEVTSKSNDLLGPGIVLGLTKRNAFRAGEKLSLKLNGSYEWQTNSSVKGSNSMINSYSYGLTASLEFPRIILFGVNNRRLHFPSSTTFELSAKQENRAGYFRMLSLSGGVTYTLQSSSSSRHEITPLGLTFNVLQHTTSKFDSIIDANRALYMSLRNQFEPYMHYSYTYNNSSLGRRNHTWFQLNVTESGNLTSAVYALCGKSFNQKNKEILANPFSQFVKVSAELRRTFRFTDNVHLATRIMGGAIFSYGNSSEAPFSEQFYVGGANSIRAFTIRSVGPGRFVPTGGTYSYIDETGDLKFEANAELRFPLVGSLKGALFLDAGNVWLINSDESRPNGKFNGSHLLDDIALGTGFGFRYDMEFIVLRVDLGVGIHVPYDTGKKGYYNIPKFKDGFGIHFAIGYPF